MKIGSSVKTIRNVAYMYVHIHDDVLDPTSNTMVVVDNVIQKYAQNCSSEPRGRDKRILSFLRKFLCHFWPLLVYATSVINTRRRQPKWSNLKSCLSQPSCHVFDFRYFRYLPILESIYLGIAKSKCSEIGLLESIQVALEINLDFRVWSIFFKSVSNFVRA